MLTWRPTLQIIDNSHIWNSNGGDSPEPPPASQPYPTRHRSVYISEICLTAPAFLFQFSKSKECLHLFRNLLSLLLLKPFHPALLLCPNQVGCSRVGGPNVGKTCGPHPFHPNNYLVHQPLLHQIQVSTLFRWQEEPCTD